LNIVFIILFYFLILFKINTSPSWCNGKGKKNGNWKKANSNLVCRIKKLHPLSLYFPHNCPISQMGFFCNFVVLNQTMVCGVSVHSKRGYLPFFRV